MLLTLVSMLALASNIQMAGPSETMHVYAIESEGSSFNGYTLFAPLSSTTTYLINNGGDVVHTWASDYDPGLSVYLLESGNLLRACAGARIQEIEWNGTVIWDFECSSDQHDRHHDIEPLPNGNVLVIAHEHKTAEEAIAAGRDPDMISAGELQPDHVIEVEPTGETGGNIVWEWHVWDHLIQDYDSNKENYGIVADHPELVDINFPRSGPGSRRADWNHMNSIAYNEEFDQILLSVNTFNEIWVIDHSTTIEEAAGHTGGNSGRGGDLLYRWGNPQAYRAGDESDRKLFKQHDAQWIGSGLPGEGDILVFNNGNNRPDGSYSSVDEIVPPVDENGNYSLIPGSAYGPEEQTWIYTAENPPDFFSTNLSGAQRLPNGNTLICSGANGYFFEVTPEKETVWEFTNPFPDMASNRVFKVRRFAPDYPGLADLIQPTKNDVAVTAVTTRETIIGQGTDCPINATIENQGDFAETFDVTAYANTTAIQMLTVTNLAAGNSIIISFSWNTTGFPYGSYTISVNATTVPNETETIDNVFVNGVVTVTVRSDLNGDGAVDVADLATVAIAFGTQPGDPYWNADADLNKDNRVDIDDLIIVALDYGKTV